MTRHRQRQQSDTNTESGFSVQLARAITGFAGSMPFFYFHVVFFTAWLSINNGVFGQCLAFDPYPHGFLTLVVSLEAIFLGTFTLISQNSMHTDGTDHTDHHHIAAKVDQILVILNGKKKRM
jgi:uncharacterized membrane protein